MTIRERAASRWYRIQETVAHRFKRRVHEALCPFCCGLARHSAENERQLRWQEAWHGQR